MKRVFGLETEYGITLSGAESVDVVAESIELVRRYTEHGALMKWDYELEDPHLDARGFRARELLQDTDESAYYEIDKNRPLSFEEIKSDLVLSNGARFYNDHAHPEYSTPECTTLRQIVSQDKAGERILAECARRRNQKLPPGYEVRLYKNNTDFVGHSYGCHDNYLMRRDIAWDRIVAGVLPFLVTRQIFAGAGKMGVEAESASGEPDVFQISQRADFFSVLVSIDTMNRRPLVNTRDEPHADASRYRRFHVILGDSNMSQWATAMKIGATSLVLDLIERGKAPQLEIAQPINANKSISRDQTYDWIIELKDGRKISAIDVQRIYLKAAAAIDDGTDEDRQWILREWENVLNDLERDVMLTRDRVDWAAKKFLLNALQQEEKLSWRDPWLQSIDLEYHNLDFERGLYYELARQGAVRRVVPEDEIKTSIFNPPETTRAFFRGRSVARFNNEISSIQWDEIVFENQSQLRRIVLPEAAADARLSALNHAARNGKDFSEFMSAVAQIDYWKTARVSTDHPRTRKIAIGNSKSIKSLPLDRARRFARDIVADAIDAFDFVADASRDAGEQFIGKPHPICSHAILTFDDTEHDRVFVSPLIAHHADGADRQQDGERLPDAVIPIGRFHLAHDDRVRFAQDRQSLRRDFTQDANGETGSRERLTVNNLFRQTELQTGLAHFIFEKLANRFDQLEVHFLG